MSLAAEIAFSAIVEGGLSAVQDARAALQDISTDADLHPATRRTLARLAADWRYLRAACTAARHWGMFGDSPTAQRACHRAYAIADRRGGAK